MPRYAGDVGTVLCLTLLPCAPLFAQLTSESGLLFADSAINTVELDQQRGREGLNIEELVLQLSDVHADASISNNSLNSQLTGGNLVESGAFSNAAGLVFSVQNSGNHVVIQNTTLINVNLQP